MTTISGGSPRIVRVLAPNPGVYTLEGTNTWIVGEDPAVVIDPGPDDPDHLRIVQAEAEAGADGRVGAIFVTHSHEDHAEGAGHLSASTLAPVYAAAALPEENGHLLKDGDEFSFGRTRVTAVATPGHTPDHFVFFLPDAGALFTGDAVLGRGTSVIDPPEGDLEKYLGSLDRMADLHPRVIYPGHGPAVFDAMGKIDEYALHRAEREEQILAALSAGLSHVGEIVASVYADYPADVYPLAARSVVAHLQKLEGEDRADHSGKPGEERYVLSAPRACRRCGRRVRGKATLCGRCSLAVLQEGPSAEEDPAHESPAHESPAHEGPATDS